MSRSDLLQQTRQYYDHKLAEYGPTARGVDWNSEESQRLRFRELVRLIEGAPDARVLDYGCGYGALRSYLRERGHRGPYVGFDISERMIDIARIQAGDDQACFTTERTALERVDYTLASGIFNVKQGASDEEWRQYMLDTIDELAELSISGFGFNVLSRYSDPDRRRPDLYYADPLDVFDHCKRHVSRFVSLLHDTPLYEFTLLVSLPSSPEERTPASRADASLTPAPRRRA
jgi:SAM-dependent methyltransferase